MSSPSRNKRREMDVMKLLMSDWKVELVNDSTKELEVDFTGPSGSPYEGGLWKVRVEIPDSYPYKSPSIGFKNRIFHPNVDEAQSSAGQDLCAWMSSTRHGALSSLLLYPNPTDPLNGDAAALLIREPDSFDKKVRDYVKKYACNSFNTAVPDRDGPATPDPAVSVRKHLDESMNGHVSNLDQSPSNHNAAPQGSSSSDGNLEGMLTDSDEGD